MVIVHIAPDLYSCFIIGFQLLIQEVLFGASEKAAAPPGRVIKTGPDSPNYYACGLLRSRQRDCGSPMHPSGGYAASHAAPLLRTPSCPSIAPTSPESCTCVRRPEAECLRESYMRFIER